MWTMTREGFFSTAEIPGNPKSDLYLQVRARRKGDLENLVKTINTLWTIETHAGTDYPYRIYLPRKLWAAYLHQAALDIDYDNSKRSLHQRELFRKRVYMNCWIDLLELQDDGQ